MAELNVNEWMARIESRARKGKQLAQERRATDLGSHTRIKGWLEGNAPMPCPHYLLDLAMRSGRSKPALRLLHRAIEQRAQELGNMDVESMAELIERDVIMGFISGQYGWPLIVAVTDECGEGCPVLAWDEYRIKYGRDLWNDFMRTRRDT